MDIRALGYIGIDATAIDAWRDYGRLLGAMVADAATGGGVDVKIDERPYRVHIQPATSDGLAFAGWELADESALETAAAELEAAGHEVQPGTAGECEARRVRGLLHTTDPGGFALELFHGPILDHRPFVSPTGVSGFVTGDMGLGHIVLGTTDHADALRFYRDTLGFRVSDYMRAGKDDVVFMHCNARHHSLALVPAAESVLYHFMLEVSTVDDVGYALERHESSAFPISMGLGRHPNDGMLSFYGASPSGFDVEYGCGGLRVDDADWTVNEITKASLWGHRRPAPA